MRYIWLLDQEAQRLFSFHQHQGQEKIEDYLSKHNNGNNDQHVYSYYVHMDNSPTRLS